MPVAAPAPSGALGFAEPLGFAEALSRKPIAIVASLVAERGVAWRGEAWRGVAAVRGP